MGTVSSFSSDSLFDSSLYSIGTTQQTEQTAQQPATRTTSGQDSVTLSDAAQAKLLYKQGESVSTIAHAMGTTTKTVDDYLGITEEEELEKVLQQTEAAKA